mmetsp:Transcript_10452/g.20660  ORF Transcript_10452/g.20660 Transcript_10452/m.20660 type:complete len:135 (+) Transcript_10452:59-463(+)
MYEKFRESNALAEISRRLNQPNKNDASTTSSSSLEERSSDDTPSSSTTSHPSTTTSSSRHDSSMAQSEEDTQGGDSRSKIQALNTAAKENDAHALASFLDQFQGIEKVLMESAEKEANDEKTVLYAIDYIANSS